MPSFLSRFFSRPAAAPEPVLHKGCRIFPETRKEAGSFRIAARIEKDFAGTVKTHQLLRVDSYTDRDEALAASVEKARLAIDQLGDSLFG